MIVDRTINRVVSNSGDLQSILLDLSNDTVTAGGLEKNRTAHDKEGEPITGEMAIEDAEAYAIGTRKGVPVDPTDDAYNNNSLYYSVVSGSIARIAGNHALAASASAESALDDARKAQSYATGDAVDDQGNPYRPGQDEDCAEYYYQETKHIAETAGFVDFTGATATEDGVHGLIPQPMAGEQNRAITGNGEWGFDISTVAPVEETTALNDHAIGDQFLLNGLLYEATAQIYAEDVITPGVNCQACDSVIEQMKEGFDNSVLGVKGDAESTYRDGNVNLTFDNLVSGPLPVDKGGTNATTVPDIRKTIGIGNSSGNLPIKIDQGGTGMTVSPSAKVDLGSTSSANLFQATPSLGVTGKLPFNYGGTNATSRLTAAKALANENVGSAATYFVGMTDSWEKFGYVSIANVKTVLGLGAAAYIGTPIAVNKGGTGATTHTSNSILAGNGTSALKHISTASGALYATSANGAASFGTLPVAQGGTGQTKLYDMFSFDMYTKSSVSVPANSITYITNETISKAGYYPLGMIGLKFDGNASCFAFDWHIESRAVGSCKLGVGIRNISNSAVTVDVKAHILWIKA